MKHNESEEKGHTCGWWLSRATAPDVALILSEAGETEGEDTSSASPAAPLPPQHDSLRTAFLVTTSCTFDELSGGAASVCVFVSACPPAFQNDFMLSQADQVHTAQELRTNKTDQPILSIEARAQPSSAVWSADAITQVLRAQQMPVHLCYAEP